jgi:hypothetical protein
VRELVPGLAGATTEVSGLMLRAAVAGHFPESVQGLLVAMAGRDLDAVREWAVRLAGLGASSGQDMLAGILFWLDD